MIDSKPRFLQGAFGFTGAGYARPVPIDPALRYVVPADKRAQLIYLRGGNSIAEMVFVALMVDGKPARLFPLSAQGGAHVPLAVVEDLEPDTAVDIYLGAPEGSSGTVVIDLGILEI